MFGSDLVRQEAAQTKDENQRTNLIIDFQGLKPVPKDKIIHGFSHQADQYGGFVTFPLVSDTSDDKLRDKLMERGLGREDAAHLTHAITNACDVFLTRDVKTIIQPHGAWLENEFPKLKIWRPSQLLEFVQTQVGPLEANPIGKARPVTGIVVRGRAIQRERRMPSVNELRKHVFDDALELAATTGMLIPLIDAELSGDEEAHLALGFLQKHLARHVALVVTRLHESPRDKGPTGATASITALLEHARNEGRLSAELFESIHKRA